VKTKVRVTVIGASGCAGEELGRLLLTHPDAELAAVTSRQFAGKKLSEAFPRFGKFAAADTIVFRDSDPAQLGRDAEIVFLALPHRLSVEFARPLLDAGVRVIDLSADFRLPGRKFIRSFMAPRTPIPSCWRRRSTGCRRFITRKFGRRDWSRATLFHS
jgi:N-acetyl-gamma-glutamyl-phosphate reductase